MRHLDALKKRLNDLSPVIEKQYSARIIGVFGSQATGNDHSESDIDLLADFQESATLFDYIDLCQFLEKKLDLSVDLVTENSIREEMREPIYDQLVRL